MGLITFSEKNKTFHLSNKDVSYIFSIQNGYLVHHHYGMPVREYNHGMAYPKDIRSSFSPNIPGSSGREYSLDSLLQEFPTNNQGDYRMPGQIIEHQDGSRITDFKYHHHEIMLGKDHVEGLPSLYVNEIEEAETLLVYLKDQLSNLEAVLSYTVFRDLPSIIRSVKICNRGNHSVRIKRLMSCSIDLPSRENEVIHLAGTWASERNIVREKLSHGIKIFDSKRGSSSHNVNPFVSLLSPTTTEEVGEAFGYALIYSGNHETAIEVDSFNQTRVQIGINSHDFSWELTPGESFSTPEALLVYSSQGLGNMSRTYHELFRNNLTRGNYKYADRPVLVNNWEATYMDFTSEKILNIAKESQQLGIELFVLDDGWFGERNDDKTSLGDWFVNEKKIPEGLETLSKKIKDTGMGFGLWFEPEMVSEESQLYKKHPDWLIHTPKRESSLGRDQYVLDFSRAEVRENIFEQMRRILDSVPIDYIKWDMNRSLSEVYSKSLPSHRQGEVAHRYVLGLYDFLEKLTQAYPSILFESCSGGGGRFDPGMLYYMPQTWTSDNTDPIARLKIQYGTSLLYPTSAMGAHVSASPNHQTGRRTSIDLRGNVAFTGVFGYELDVESLNVEEKIKVKEQVEFYKLHRKLLQYGDFYRLQSPFESNQAAWMCIEKDKNEAILFLVNVLAEASPSLEVLKLAGLEKSKMYQLNGDKVFGGDELMGIGLYYKDLLNNQTGDFISSVVHLKAI